VGGATDDAPFRAAAREFLAAHAAPRTGAGDWSTGPRDDTPGAQAAFFARCRAWQRTLFDGGWAGIAWPREWGGRGGTAADAAAFGDELAAFDATSGFVGATVAMAGAALLAHGTDAQKRRFLTRLLRADDAWCQLFSEPGAGSDLANVATRAMPADEPAGRGGPAFIVDGQKVWTSNAQFCDWGLLLARTDPAVPKHRGMTFLLVDLRTPGVEIRPLRQISGRAHFSEVFLTGVRIPADQVVGTVGGGWAVARTVLAQEAGLAGSTFPAADAAALAALARATGVDRDPLLRQAIAAATIEERILGWLGERSVDPSVVKVAWSEGKARKDLAALAALGPAGALSGGDAPAGGYWQTQVLDRWWGTVGGGTNEIHRTMIGERALGLPPEPRVDKDVPWRDQAGGVGGRADRS
jgi:alkylation response protein AidB-like acyl-CoA dehydrogenase